MVISCGKIYYQRRQSLNFFFKYLSKQIQILKLYLVVNPILMKKKKKTPMISILTQKEKEIPFVPALQSFTAKITCTHTPMHIYNDLYNTKTRTH